MASNLYKGFGASKLVLKDLENTENFKKGSEADNVPQALQKHFPNTTLMGTRSLPGVYVAFSPMTEKFYIGFSHNISYEISMKRPLYK
jgi:hypothetical protein